jgi:UDP-glucose 4-epimerase
MKDLKDSTALITGGAGFVGSSICDRLLAKGVKRIIILDNLVRGSKANIKDALASRKVQFFQGSICDRRLLDRIGREDIDFCFHMAALQIRHCAEDPEEAFKVMFEGTFNVAEACARHKVRKVAVASSASIYGHADTFPTREDHHPYHNVTLYGAAKTANELMFRSFRHMHGLRYVALRYFNIYGPRMNSFGKYTEVLIRWYQMIRRGERPLIFGDGKQTMDFIYVEDAARASVLALESEEEDEVFNIASGIETSLEELCRMLLKVMGARLKPKFAAVSEDRRKVEVQRRLADISKAREKIGFKPEISLEEGLTRLCSWLDRTLPPKREPYLGRRPAAPAIPRRTR